MDPDTGSGNDNPEWLGEENRLANNQHFILDGFENVPYKHL